jgi:hypothetical protein
MAKMQGNDSAAARQYRLILLQYNIIYLWFTE